MKLFAVIAATALAATATAGPADVLKYGAPECPGEYAELPPAGEQFAGCMQAAGFARACDGMAPGSEARSAAGAAGFIYGFFVKSMTSGSRTIAGPPAPWVYDPWRREEDVQACLAEAGLKPAQ